ncbi:MAG TPA: hypothetical protein VFL94_10120 [Actinomycetales bacterium]|nr:hypothetical protein [Actinomycetales bacterium]
MGHVALVAGVRSAARRSGPRRIVVRLLIAASVAAALGLLAPASAPASCVGPQLTVTTGADATHGSTAEAPAIAPSSPGSPTRVFPGDPLAVEGRYFHDGCADMVEVTACSGPRTVDPETPARQVELQLVQGDRSWVLGRADAGDAGTDYGIRWHVAVPDDVPSGPAQLVARGATAQLHVWR